MMKKLLAAALAVVLTFVLAVPGFAMTAEQIATVEQTARQLSDKYGVNIRYDLDADGTPSIGTGTLGTMDAALSAVTPEVVRQISDYWQQKIGRRITYSFVYSPFQLEDYEVLGSFDESNAVIEIYLPSSSYRTFSTGDSPITFVHELGHAFHLMCIDKYGASALQQEWQALNRGKGYTNSMAADYDRHTFVTNYAASTYMEDFAECFGHAFVRNRAGQGFYTRLSSDGNRTALGDKIAFVESMLSRYTTSNETALANYRKVYTTPVSIDWNGVRLSGDHLQFMGCVYPRYVLAGILGDIRVEAGSSTWVRDIGGWYVEAAGTNKPYLIFPGGIYMELESRVNLA